MAGIGREGLKSKKRPAPKKATRLKASAAPKKSAAKKRPAPHAPLSGYVKENGIFIPDKAAKKDGVVPTSKLRAGIKKAKTEISDLLEELQDLASGFGVSEVELTVSFSADGKFLGVGVGGATSITIKLSPGD